jgi:hypothetical protein
MVGIELRRVCFRRRVTTLTLSVARWVRNSAMATFSEGRVGPGYCTPSRSQIPDVSLSTYPARATY